MTSSVPYSFSFGEIAKSQEVNENFDYLANNRADKDLSNITADGIEVIKNNSAYSRNIGELVWSTLEQSDSSLRLANGDLIESDGVYADFVAAVANKYQSQSQGTATTYNVNLFGDITNTDGVLSNFSSLNYAKLLSIFNPGVNDWTMIIYAKTPSSYNSEEFIVGNGVTEGTTNVNFQGISLSISSSGYTKLYLSSNGTSWNIANGVSGASFLSSSTYYYFRIIKNGDTYTLSVSSDGENWDTQNSITSSANVYTSSQPLCLGGNFITSGHTNEQYWSGEIDLRESYIVIGGNIWWSGTVKNIPSFTTESIWQRTVAIYGACGKFVYDSVNNTVRLPKLKGIIEGTNDLSSLGGLIQAGLPNVTGYFNATSQSRVPSTGTYGNAIYRKNYTTAISAGTQGGEDAWYQLDASRSSSIYGNSTTVQPQAIRLYPYIVVGTSTKTDIQVNIDNVVTELNRLSHSYVVETYSNGSSWYRVYSDGWCEQGGQVFFDNVIGFKRVEYLKPFVTEPDVVITLKGCYANASIMGSNTNNAQESTTSYFTTYLDSNIPYKNWRACGRVS